MRSFIFPIFEELWKLEIDEMEFHKSTGQTEEKSQGSEGPFNQAEANEVPDELEFTQEEVESALREMLDQQEQMITNIEDTIEGKVNLDFYGISQGDQQLFQFYSNKMKKERDEMHQFWRKLIGDASSEINVKKNNEIKRKLDVGNLINPYPGFEGYGKK